MSSQKSLFQRWRQGRQLLSVDDIPKDKPYFAGRTPIILLLILAIIGTFATGFLTYRHIVLATNIASVGDSPLCRAVGSVNCDGILTTEYSVLLKYFPSSVLGLMGFSFVLWLLMNALFVDRLRKVTWVLLLVYFFAAIGFSWYYIYIMIYEVDYLCTWCMVVHAVNFLSLGIVIYTAIKSRRGFLYPEIAPWPERIYFITAAFVIPLAVYSSSMMVEKWLSFDDIKIKYEELANDPVVIMALLKTSPTFEVEVAPGDPIFGDPDAQYPIFFFSDFQCPICPRTEEYLKSLVNLNPGLLKLVYKNYPLSNECNPILLGNLHPLGCKAARAAYAAYLLGGSKAFWDYSDLLFQNQKKLKNEPWIEFAEMLKLDTGKFQTLLQEDSEAARKVLSDIDLGITLKLSATPQVFFQGKNIPQTFKGEYLVDAMEELVKSNDPGKKDFSLRRR